MDRFLASFLCDGKEGDGYSGDGNDMISLRVYTLSREGLGVEKNLEGMERLAERGRWYEGDDDFSVMGKSDIV